VLDYLRRDHAVKFGSRRNLVDTSDKHFCIFRQPVEHFQLRAEIPPDMNRLPVNMIALRSHSLSEKISYNAVSSLSTKHLKLPTLASLYEVAPLLSNPAHLHDTEIVA